MTQKKYGNTQITLHNTSLDRIVDILRSETDRTGNPTPGTIANTIEAQLPSTRDENDDNDGTSRRMVRPDGCASRFSNTDAIALAGLPGAGKSHVGDILSEVFGVSMVSMGDAIRWQFLDAHGSVNSEDDFSSALGSFAAKTRSEAPEQIPEWTLDLVADNYPQADLVIIDGVRSVTDYEVLADAFDRFYLLWVEAPFEVRLNRIIARGREGEDTFDRVDLAERDKRELEELGVRELRDLDPDEMMQVTNNRGVATVRRNLARLVHDNLPFDVETNEPLLTPVGNVLAA